MDCKDSTGFDMIPSFNKECDKIIAIACRKLSGVFDGLKSEVQRDLAICRTAPLNMSESTTAYSDNLIEFYYYIKSACE